MATHKRTSTSKTNALPAYYLRVSTDEQKKSGLGIEAQRAACHAELVKRGLVVADAIEYLDNGISGTTPLHKRSGLTALITDVQSGKISIVVTLDTSRIARKVSLIKSIADVFIAHNVIFASIKESYIDTSTAIGAMMFHNKIAIDQFESDITSERTKAALAERKKKFGYASGKLPLGYDRNPATETIFINENNARIVRSIFNWRNEGMTLRAIADRVTDATQKVWYASSVKAILDNEAKYSGAESAYPAIL